MQVYVCNNIDRVHGRIPQPGIALVRGQYYIYRMRTCVLKPELGGQLASPAGIALVRGQYYIYRMRTCVLTHPHIARASFKKNERSVSHHTSFQLLLLDDGVRFSSIVVKSHCGRWTYRSPRKL